MTICKDSVFQKFQIWYISNIADCHASCWLFTILRWDKSALRSGTSMENTERSIWVAYRWYNDMQAFRPIAAVGVSSVM